MIFYYFALSVMYYTKIYLSVMLLIFSKNHKINRNIIECDQMQSVTNFKIDNFDFFRYAQHLITFDNISTNFVKFRKYQQHHTQININIIHYI